MDISICKNCINSKDIQNIKLISKKKKCIICGEVKENALENEKCIKYINNLVSYNYPMYKYCYTSAFFTKSELFSEKNLIFNGTMNESYSRILRALLQSKRPKEELLEQHFAKPLKECKSALVNELENDIKNKNYFEIYNKYINEFKHLRDILPIEDVVKNQSGFFRARCGFNNKWGMDDDLHTEIKFPYVNEELDAPPNMLATPGRFNREGCSFLYLANKKEVAITELRPDIGQICSIGEFISIEEQKFADLRKNSIDKISTEEKAKEKSVLHSIRRLIASPIASNEKNKYLLTQFISDIFRELGLSGIVYDSTLTTGYNHVAFFPSKFRIKEKSEIMMKVNSVEYSIEELKDERLKYKNFTFDNDDDESKYTLEN